MTKQTTQLLNESVEVEAEGTLADTSTGTPPAITLIDDAMPSSKWANAVDTTDSDQVQELYDQLAKQPKEPHAKEKLIRSDFKRILIKGANKSYWSFKSTTLELEVCLEPCLGGFCVAIYGNKYSIIQEAPELKEKKVCTNIELPEKLFKKELIEGTQERNEETWDKGLKIANSIWRKHKNNKKLKNWGMIDKDSGPMMSGAASLGGAVSSGYLQTATTNNFTDLQSNGYYHGDF